MPRRSHKPDPRSALGHGRRRRAARASDGRASLIERFEQALSVRAPLLASPLSNTCRVLNGAADGIDGLVIEKLGDVLIVQLHEGRLQLPEREVRDLCAHAQLRLGARAVYRKFFARDRSAALPTASGLHADPKPWLGEAVEAEFPVLENGIRFLIRPYEGYSVGLFLEHRDSRQRVRSLAEGRTVLNGFAYTCAFSVAAALGGATETVSVDISKKSLEWGKRNFATNRLDLGRQRFICSDIFGYYRRARRQQRSFDLVILDPPTFARSKRSKRVFALPGDLERLVTGAVGLLNPGGYLLLATNHRRTTRRELERVIVVAAGTRPVAIVARPRLPLDFSGDQGYARSVLARLD